MSRLPSMSCTQVMLVPSAQAQSFHWSLCIVDGYWWNSSMRGPKLTLYLSKVDWVQQSAGCWQWDCSNWQNTLGCQKCRHPCQQFHVPATLLRCHQALGGVGEQEILMLEPWLEPIAKLITLVWPSISGGGAACLSTWGLILGLGRVWIHAEWMKVLNARNGW